MYVYKVTNRLNRLIYIGASTREVKESKNYFGSGREIKKALQEFGKENFTKEILQECETVEELHVAERYWIKELDATNPDVGYNLKLISADGNYGRTFSDEHKKKMSDAKKGENHPFYGRTFSDEHKKKLSENHADVSGKNAPVYKMTPEQRSERAKKANDSLTPEQRSERAKRAWETRRRNQALNQS